MILEESIKEQLKQYLQLIENNITITVSLGEEKSSLEMKEFIYEIASFSKKITIQEKKLKRTPSFMIGERISFAGIPLGHEFTSFIMALLQVSGRKPKISDELIEQIKQIKETYNFETYISLSCHNCPDVVQALNIMSVLNPNITHTMIDGGFFQEEVTKKDIMAVPSVYMNESFFESGRMLLEEILLKLGSKSTKKINSKDYDVTIIGGGPAGAAAAIYAARKGINTAIISERFGGQVMDTLGIENLIGTKYTEGPKLVSSLEEHIKEYNVDLFNLEKVQHIEKDNLFKINLESGNTVKSKTIILATGAKWRNLNVPGESEFKNKGVAYCPHCDGPLFKGKHVAVIGGGNSGVEAAIDLAGIVSHVTLIEFGDKLKADKVLQDRLRSLNNTTIITNAQTKEITGNDKVNGITYIERDTGLEQHINLQGVFIQIGLIPNTEWLGDLVEKTRFGEIVVNNHGATDIPGIFAAGDCTNHPYKQIVISMGSGATAALGAFDYLIRN